jgi:hypothetical protein
MAHRCVITAEQPQRQVSNKKNQSIELSGSIHWEGCSTARGKMSTSGRHFFSTIGKILNLLNVIFRQNAIATEQNANFMLSANLANTAVSEAQLCRSLLNRKELLRCHDHAP